MAGRQQAQQTDESDPVLANSMAVCVEPSHGDSKPTKHLTQSQSWLSGRSRDLGMETASQSCLANSIIFCCTLE